MKKIKFIFVLASISIVIAAYFLFSYYTTFYKPNTTKTNTYLYIHKDTSYSDLLDSLRKTGAIINIRSFERAAIKMKLDKNFMYGRYKIEEGISNKRLITKIISNDQEPLKLVISGNIRNIEKIAKIFDKKIEADYEEILSILQNDSIINSYGFNKRTFISMFLPYTHEIYWTISVNELLDKLKDTYKTFWDKKRVTKAKSIGMTESEVATLASIVYEESKIPEEQPIIAGVYINRLKIGMPLQADPTIIFALNDYSIRRVLKKHLEVNSPYNTYKFKGLPPGPISVAPIATIDAVLNYDRHKYVYFCASPQFNGSHLFAETILAHTKNALAYRRALNSRNIKR